MNKDINKALKIAVICGIAGAVFVPVCYEVYANISRNIACFLLLAAACAVGVRLCVNKLSSALLAFVTMFVMEAGLGIVGFMIIHPAIKSYLSDHSKYFYLGLADSARYFVNAALIQLVIPAILIAKAAFLTAFKKLKENSEAAGKYIDNAFDDNLNKHGKDL